MEYKKEMTIYDLAEKLNISPATVSRALSDHPAVSKKTKRKVSALAEEIGYRRNSSASNLRKQKTHTIGVIVHELNSHFITSVVSGIEKVAAEAHYNIIIGHSGELASKEIANTKNLFHKRVDGLLVSLAYDTKDLSHYDPFIQRGIPIVFFDRVNSDAKGIKVVIDNYKAGYEAAVHLIQQGCKRMFHLTGNLARNVYMDRLNGFKKALTEHHLPFEPEQLLITDLSERAGIAAATQIMKMETMPDGLFIANDLCAAVCMQSLKDGGLKVPEDIAMVGFNNDIISRVVDPKLTTFNYMGREMGEVAANSLIDQLKGGSSTKADYTIVLPSELIVRSSSIRRRENH